MNKEIALEMFWTIEHKDINKLITLCNKLTKDKIYMRTYYPFIDYESFTIEEFTVKGIKGLVGQPTLNFSPLEHAINIKWNDGIKVLECYTTFKEYPVSSQ